MKLWSRKNVPLLQAHDTARFVSGRAPNDKQGDDKEEGEHTPMTSPTASDAPPPQGHHAHEAGSVQARPSSLSAERAAITRRVATFRAYQAKLEQERADYYNATQRKIATALSLPPAQNSSASHG